ncbi:hypothetical protein Bhyg_16180 [Pseudolycoriella hygida]|uniref:Peptidase C45 hydrolase domain-containing protein n=1 Tax=Pseudolycoriella hygida TaxID=35572 RepID=A0A9Q0MIG9_9DIPT|nr:hypothetical protein Bhyg_16180 [Pseudolycoriella hygida]
MASLEQCRILDQIPILYARGTHYEVGLSVGRTFKSMHQEIFSNWDFFNNVLLKNYNSDNGKNVYEHTLRLCEKKFPFYVEELRGMADGSGVPFYKLFLAHLDCLMTPQPDDTKNAQIQADSGCTSILCNDEEMIMAHNEDAFPEHADNVYIVVVDIFDKSGNKFEKFAALCYPGMLPGLAMSFNDKGLVFTINTLVPKSTFEIGTPRFFLTRALLRAANHEEVMQTLLDNGTGIGDGVSINICYVNKENVDQRPTMYNIEVAPPKFNENLESERKSEVSVKCVPAGSIYVHCNKYLHLEVLEINESLTSSINRHEAILTLPVPSTIQRVKTVLSDRSVIDYPVYRRCQTAGKDGAKTVATGIFDIRKMEWSVYVNMPTESEATVVLSMNL